MRFGQTACIVIMLLALSACVPTCDQPGTGWTSYTKVTAIREMAFDADGNLWIVQSEGVTKWDIGRETYITYTSADGLLEDEVLSIATGSDGTVWFGFEDGVSYFDGERWGTYTTTHGLPEGDIVSVATTPEGEVWAATWQVGVSRFDGEQWTTYYTTADGVVNTGFSSVAVATDGTLWGGKPSIASRFDGKTWTTYAFPYDYKPEYHSVYITAIAIAPAGAVWFATQGSGVFHFDDGAWFHYLSRNGLANSTVTSVALTPDGAVWFGTERGASRLIGETWTTYTTVDGLVSDDVTAIAVAPDGALWFGTDAGLSRYELPD